MADIFISYAREDTEKARQIADSLAARGWSVFWDHTIPPGQSWRSYIGEALNNARCVIVLWSSASLVSEFVHEEADVAKRNGTLLPVLIEPVTPPLGFGQIQAANLAEWSGARSSEAIIRLSHAVASILGVPVDGAISNERRDSPKEKGNQADQPAESLASQGADRKTQNVSPQKKSKRFRLIVWIVLAVVLVIAFWLFSA